MKILFDHNLPRRLREHLPGHEIRTTREMKWEQLRNGALMSVAAAAGFEVFVTIDKQIEHQQNLATLALTVVVVDGKSNALPALLPFTPFLRDLFGSSLQRDLYVVEEGGNVLQLKEPAAAEHWGKEGKLRAIPCRLYVACGFSAALTHFLSEHWRKNPRQSWV